MELGLTVKSGYVLNKGNPLNYLEWGSPTSPVIVFLHGLRDCAYEWRPTAERLAVRYRCIALNFRGHGDSGPSPEREYTYGLFMSDVRALVQELDLPHLAIIGHSLGARAAIAYAATYRDGVSAIVVAEHAPHLPEEAAQNIKRAMAATPVAFDSWGAAVAFLKERRPSPSSALMEERAPYLLQRLPTGKITWKGDPLVREEWLGPGLPPRAKVNVWEDLAKVACPLLVVKGETSRNLDPEVCQRMVSDKESSYWVEIPGTAHWVHDDNLDGFLNAVEPFLARFTAKDH